MKAHLGRLKKRRFYFTKIYIFDREDLFLVLLIALPVIIIISGTSIVPQLSLNLLRTSDPIGSRKSDSTRHAPITC